MDLRVRAEANGDDKRCGKTRDVGAEPVKIGTILEQIDLGKMAPPEFQRGYVWNRDQVRGLMDSLCRRHPVGGFLFGKRTSTMPQLGVMLPLPLVAGST